MAKPCEAYCSVCFEMTTHTLVKENLVGRNEYRCTGCRARTYRCRFCKNMTRGQPDELPEGFRKRLRAAWSDELCAEHDGTLPSFRSAGLVLDDLASYRRLFERSTLNLGRAARIAGFSVGSAAIFGPLAFVAAPGIAAALGAVGVLGAAGTGTSIGSLSGAALTSASLGALGGGFGMAGGVAFITAAGAALGAGEGAAVSNAYFGSIRGFEVSKLRHGDGPGVIFIDGFLTQRRNTLAEWILGTSRRYRDNPLYSTTWESKALADLGQAATATSAKLATSRLVGGLAKRAISKPLGMLGQASSVAELLRNPWHTAMVKASMTGILLADLIARTPRPESFVLLGHSLGARVIYYLLEALATKGHQRIHAAILLGGAVGRDAEGWGNASEAVSTHIYNCYSVNDRILRNLYKTATAFTSDPIGIGPIQCNNDKIVDVDVSDLVPDHRAYKAQLSSILERFDSMEGDIG